MAHVRAVARTAARTLRWGRPLGGSVCRGQRGPAHRAPQTEQDLMVWRDTSGVDGWLGGKGKESRNELA